MPFSGGRQAFGSRSPAGTLRAVNVGGLPWVSLSLAVSFGLYGLCKKMLNLGAITGLTLETLLLPPILALLVGVSIYHEPFSASHLLSFAFIWAALVVFSLAPAGRRAQNETPEAAK